MKCFLKKMTSMLFILFFYLPQNAAGQPNNYPNLIAVYRTSGTVIQSVSQNNLVYILDQENGITILNISDPTSPTMTGSFYIPNAHSLTINNGSAYAIAGNDLRVIDVHDPTSPFHVSATWLGYQQMSSICICHHNDSTAFITNVHGLYVVDIKDPTSPHVLNTYVDNIDFYKNAYYANNYIYLSINTYCDRSGCAGTNGLEVIDIGTPLNPQSVGKLEWSGMTEDIYTNGVYVYILDRLQGLQIVNVSSSSSLSVLGSYPLPYFYDSHIIIDSMNAYISLDSNFIDILNISDPSNITHSKRITTYGPVHSLEIKNNLLFVSEGTEGLNIYTLDEISIEKTNSKSGSFVLNNAPNPFNSSTRIEVRTEKASNTKISIFNLEGRCVDTIFEGLLPIGSNTFHWNACKHSTGCFLLKVSTANSTYVHKMMYLK